MNADFVGRWSLHPTQGDTLQYDLGWVQSRGARPISLSLPFTPGNEPHHGAKVRAYFENLLPDSPDIRERVARRYRIGGTDAFELLAQIGRDCVGALQILSDGEAPANVRTIEATSLTESEVAQWLRSAIAPAPVAPREDDDDFRISIAGAQEKAALLYFEGKWRRPHRATPTTHILKLPMGLVGNMRLDLQESVENEWLCSKIVRAYGLPVANCEPLVFEDMKVLAVERFDRAWASAQTEPWLLRRPQEDMCQASGVSPMLKYEADGGPGMDRVMTLLEASIDRTRDRRLFFQAQLIFWMLCATDGHAKNFSVFIRPGGRYELTPVYDVLSAYPFLGEGPGKLSPFRARMAMAVRSKNAHWKMRDILPRHWLAVGERFRVNTPEGNDAKSVIDDLVARTPGVVQTVRESLPPGFPESLAESVFQGLMRAAERLAD